MTGAPVPHGIFRIGDGRQRLDVDLDRFGRVLRLQQRLGDHAGDRVADEAHLVGRHCRPRRLLHLAAVAVLERHDAFERAVAGRGEIRAGVDAEHARHGARRRGVDLADDPVGMAAAHHHRMGLPRRADVVGEAAFPAHELGVLAALHRLADGEFGDRPAVRVALKIHSGSSADRNANTGLRRLPQVARRPAGKC